MRRYMHPVLSSFILLLFISSINANEMVEEFKKHVTDKQKYFRNFKVVVSYEKTHPLGSEDLITGRSESVKKVMQQHPTFTGSYTLIFDRDQSQFRCIHEGDKLHIRGDDAEIYREYSEAGYYKGYPVLYSPRDRNVALKNADNDGGVLRKEIQKTCFPSGTPMMPMLPYVGIFPNPLLSSEPVRDYLNASYYLMPDIEKSTANNLSYKLNGNIHQFVLQFVQNGNAITIEYDIKKDDVIKIARIQYSIKDNPSIIIDQIAYDAVKGVVFPKSWRMHSYLGQPRKLQYETLFTVMDQSWNHESVAKESQLAIRPTDVFLFDTGKLVNITSHGLSEPSSEYPR